MTAVINGLEARLTNSYVGHLRHALAEATLRIDLLEALAPATARMTIPDLDPAAGPPGLHMPSASASASEGPRAAEGGPPKHRMSRAVKTVEALWQEWNSGLPGQPSISALDDRWGSRWRAGRTAEVQWYSLRLEVIREIRRVSKSRRIAEISAMHTVAADHQQSGGSLDLFCKRLRRDRKERDAV